MYSVLIVDSGVIDREMIQNVLVKELDGPIECFMAACNEEAETVMREQAVDLLLVDVPHSSAYVKNLVRVAYTLHSEIHVVLLSVKSEERIARLAHQLNATGYLLKPFRAREIADMVKPLEKLAKEAQAKAGRRELELCVERIEANIEECQYKKTIETAKEYIDFLYGSGDNMSVIRTRVVEFIATLAEIRKAQTPELQKQLSFCLERFRSRYDLQSNRFEAALVMEKMLDIIFAELERRQLYSDDDLKKVLNYIDRNIKKGITLDDAAEYVNMSSSYFSKFFKKSTGINFITYVTNRKIEFAKEMLENTNMPVINIAYELSYNETNYFSKAFKKKVGMTPTEYRETCLHPEKEIIAAGA